MRTATILVVACVLIFMTHEPARAGHRPGPRSVINQFNRKLGIGWSDGYHAYGSRYSWRPRAGELHGAAPLWTPTMIGD